VYFLACDLNYVNKIDLWYQKIFSRSEGKHQYLKPELSAVMCILYSQAVVQAVDRPIFDTIRFPHIKEMRYEQVCTNEKMRLEILTEMSEAI